MSVLIAVMMLIAAEVVALVEVAGAIGVGPAILALLAISASGPWLVRRAGFGVWRRTKQRLAEGEPPGNEALDGIVVLAGGLLICIPGFITDVVGVLLLIPVVRARAGRIVAGRLGRRIVHVGPPGPIVDVESHPAPSPIPPPTGSPPFPPGPSE